ncbi:yippee-domain-containing protein [Ramicandelaber brevisporus]|nr:yippee-domain-containing protein [Ramicandelaber brevisporus]
MNLADVFRPDPLPRMSSPANTSKRTVPPIPVPARILNGTVYCCENCCTHIASEESIMAKGFFGRHGRALFIDEAINYKLGAIEDRDLMTGRHKVADIMCATCDIVLGWKYLKSSSDDQRYKEGRFILEKTRLYKVEL